MFIAMNRFQVLKGAEPDFESMWKGRNSYLNEVPGFVEFALLRGGESEEATLYASHTVWESRERFEDWTRSEAFRKAHARAGASKPMYAGPPRLELFDAVQVMAKA